ncbi:MAG: SDR family oxidoreductase [Thermodesulfobacteriota bacteirum]|nr:SDR family oxidoreductase [Thermodesulfobacteriota bacterium]
MAKSALLIGEKSDIGATIKTYLKKEGYVVTGTTSSTLDLSSKESVDNFLLKNNKKFNSIIFVAATNTPKKFLNLEDKDFDYSYDVNFKSFVFILKNLISKMPTNSNSSIIIISSLFGSFGRDKRFLYSSSKHFLNGAMKNLAIELGTYRIRVNSIAPGFIDTKMTRNNNSNNSLSKIIKKIPAGRLGKSKDIAEVVMFLLSSKASYITGQELVVDGGLTAGGFWED